jgi:hypothetical protein
VIAGARFRYRLLWASRQHISATMTNHSDKSRRFVIQATKPKPPPARRSRSRRWIQFAEDQQYQRPSRTKVGFFFYEHSRRKAASSRGKLLIAWNSPDGDKLAAAREAIGTTIEGRKGRHVARPIFTVGDDPGIVAAARRGLAIQRMGDERDRERRRRRNFLRAKISAADGIKPALFAYTSRHACAHTREDRGAGGRQRREYRAGCGCGRVFTGGSFPSSPRDCPRGLALAARVVNYWQTTRLLLYGDNGDPASPQRNTEILSGQGKREREREREGLPRRDNSERNPGCHS